MTQIFTGFELAARIQATNRARLAALGRPAVCVTLYDADSPPALAYLQRQIALAADIGLTLWPRVWARPSGAEHQLQALAQEGGVDAVALLYPLPAGLSPFAAAEAIGAAKDADAQHPDHGGAILQGRPGARLPATAMASFLCAQEVLGDLTGAEITVIGASGLIGRPLVLLLAAAGATVSLCHAQTRDLARHCRGADLVISATGVPGLLGRAQIAPGGRVLDLGIIRTAEGLRGDADQSALMGHAALLSAVPDGVGPVTTACLFANIVAAAAGLAPDYTPGR